MGPWVNFWARDNWPSDLLISTLTFAVIHLKQPFQEILAIQSDRNFLDAPNSRYTPRMGTISYIRKTPSRPYHSSKLVRFSDFWKDRWKGKL